MRAPRILVLLLAFCLVTASYARAVVVTTVGELTAAVDAANAGGDSFIWVADGTYNLSEALQIWGNNITVRGLSGDREAVVIRGQGMHGGVSHVFWVVGDDFTAQDLTLRDVYYHAIQTDPRAQAPVMRNLHILDAYEQMIKAAYDAGQPANHTDSGVVENCLLEYSAGEGPQYYIGGVDVHRGENWVIRGNVFKNITSPDPGVLAEHAVHFWNNAAGTLVEGNLIINCDRGIGFGLEPTGHSGGIIRNNMIYHPATDPYGNADAGIILEHAPGAQVYNNTIIQEHGYANAIEYRWDDTTGVEIHNNLTNKAIAQRNEAEATLSHNLTTASLDWFRAPAAGDLHLNQRISLVVDQGIALSGLDNDFDGQPRPLGMGVDIGADEYKTGAAPFGLLLQQ